MRCPVCGVEVSLHLVVPELTADEPTDPLDATVRRLEAERYGSPEPLPRPEVGRLGPHKGQP